MQSELLASARANAKLVILTNFFADLTFILPVWLLYSLNVLHFRPTVAIAIFMSIWAVSAVLEIPAGALADRLGRRKIFIIGQLLFALYPLAYAFKFPIVLLCATCLVSAVGSAMRSGALLPVVDNDYKRAGLDEIAYHRFLSNAQMATFIARVLAGAVGAWLYTLSPTWPFFAMFLATMANFLLGFFITDSPIEDNQTTTNFDHIKHTLGEVRKSDIVRSIMLAFAVFNLTAEVIWTGYQVFFEADGRSPFVIGLLFSLIALFSTFGAYVIRFASRRFQPFKLIQLFGIGVIATAILLVQQNSTLRLAAVLPMAFVSGMTLFIVTGTVQKHINNRYQATALSIVNFVQYAVYVVGSLIFGVLLQTFGQGQARVILLVSAAIASLSIAWYSLRRKALLADIVPATLIGE